MELIIPTNKYNNLIVFERDYVAESLQREVINAEAKSFANTWFKKYLLDYMTQQKENFRKIEKAFEEAMSKI